MTTVQEAGKAGGLAVKKKYGREYFSKIAKLAWVKIREKYTEDEIYWWHSRAGEKGGATNVAKGHDFSAMGKKGGKSSADKRWGKK